MAAEPTAPALRLPIVTARLRLRDFVPVDLAAVHAFGSDPEVTRFMFWGPRDAAESRAYLDRMLASQRQRPRLVWELAVVRRANDALIGACDLTLDDDGATGDLGYLLARPAWGAGYATEIARALVAAGFEQLRLRRIFATCDIDNAASARVLEKAGLRFEARLGHHIHVKDRWWHSLQYGLDATEWRAGVPAPA
jgi:[ribosomal protein S5]-alanine N-acetyltransferase